MKLDRTPVERIVLRVKSCCAAGVCYMLNQLLTTRYPGREEELQLVHGINYSALRASEFTD